MDPEEVARLVADLKLSAEAKVTTINITKEVAESNKNRMRKLLVGKIFDNKVVNKETLRLQVPRILQCQRSPEIEIVGDNRFVAVFAIEEDKKHALVDGPWHFFNSLMSFKAPQGLQDPSEVKFEEITLWAQCHNLPVACMNPMVVRKIGEQIGKVEEIDTGEGGHCLGQFARVRITTFLNKPLKRCVNIKVDDEKAPRLVLLRYERLPDFCHACGRVGHVLRHCDDKEVDKEVLGYGNCMKVTRVVDTRRPRETGRNNTSGPSNPMRGALKGGRSTNKGRWSDGGRKSGGTDEGAIVISDKGDEVLNQEQGAAESDREESLKMRERDANKDREMSENECEDKHEGWMEMNSEKEEDLLTASKKGLDKTEKKKWKRLARERAVQTEAMGEEMCEDVAKDRKRSAQMVSLTPSMISDKRTKGEVIDNAKKMAITAESAEQIRRAQ